MRTVEVGDGDGLRVEEATVNQGEPVGRSMIEGEVVTAVTVVVV